MKVEVDPARWRELNRAWWDERVPLHVASDLYGVDAFKAGAEQLRPFELELAGDVSGLRLAHLQCHFGLDSMSWARHGASVVGVDFSQPAVDTANGLAAELGLDASFVCADVYDAAAALGGERFDLVYTGLGALNWLLDLGRWADTVASLLKPGGRLLLPEFHPATWMFGESLTVEHDYFRDDPEGWEEPGSYADEAAQTTANTTVERQHTLGEVLTVILGAGLRIDAFVEHGHTLYPRFDFLEQRAGEFHHPPGQPRIPHLYVVVASAPG